VLRYQTRKKHFVYAKVMVKLKSALTAVLNKRCLRCFDVAAVWASVRLQIIWPKIENL